MVINIQYLTDIDPIEQKEYSAWIDLRCAEDIKMKTGEFKLIPLGVCCKLPQHWESIIAPRSSTFKKYGILMPNSPAVIENDYCGPDDQWFMPAYAVRDTFIPKNDRICHFRVVKSQPGIQFSEQDFSKYKNRGGFGSSGSSNFTK